MKEKVVVYSKKQNMFVTYALDGVLTLKDLIESAKEHFMITEVEDYEKLIVGTMPFQIDGETKVCMCRTSESVEGILVDFADRAPRGEIEIYRSGIAYHSLLTIYNTVIKGSGIKPMYFGKVRLYPVNRFGAFMLTYKE